MKLYTELLTENKIDEKQLSPALKRMIKDYKEIQKFITDGEPQLQSEKLTDRKKQKLEDELAEARETVTEMESELLKKVQHWLDNREKNIEKGKQLAASRQSKKNPPAATTNGSVPSAAQGSEPATTQTPASSTEPATNTPAAASQGANTGEPASQGTQEPKKKKSNAGMIFAGIFTVLCAIAGIAYYKNQKESI